MSGAGPHEGYHGESGDVEVASYLGEAVAHGVAIDPQAAPTGAATADGELIIILDFGSQYSRLIARRVREHHVYCELIPRHPGDDRGAQAQRVHPVGWAGQRL